MLPPFHGLYLTIYINQNITEWKDEETKKNSKFQEIKTLRHFCLWTTKL